ncbi:MULTISPECIES: hypothetical protein [Methylobacterium]|uniref:Uncharacterized protein n=1 Tax=Methylobacterium isbiliense TaxID=315478 RepID=A0ABQ4SL21_9HYPH|nr:MULTISPECIES: hypothetical protein [Methylobacterium]MBX9933515.1 hypothetical protein [Methylobacterium sp.]MDN3626150.1 hypothetical protein [Methylobacterium isbiliense]GJE03001.1 hypothetical protein GMJLKIPL_4952 [Methylobacterium isbiliense]
MVEGEPSLDELVAEPIVRMMMASDGVDIAAFKRLLEDVRRVLESRRRALLDPLDGDASCQHADQEHIRHGDQGSGA